MKTSQQGIDLITHYESLHDGDLTLVGLQPKMCPAQIWTEGYGAAMLYKGKFLKGEENKTLAYSLQKIHTVDDAIAKLKEDLSEREAQLNGLYMDLVQNEFDACISFIFNLGFKNFSGSTLLRRINAKAGSDEIIYEFVRWNKSGGVVLPGLTYRRQSEALLFTTGELKFFN